MGLEGYYGSPLYLFNRYLDPRTQTQFFIDLFFFQKSHLEFFFLILFFPLKISCDFKFFFFS